MNEIDKRIGLTRLMLAEIDLRATQKDESIQQYQMQIARVVEATVGHAGDVGQALAAMAEVEERLAQAEIGKRHLTQLRARAGRELEALLLTKRVAEATAQLAALEGRRQELATQLAALDPAPERGAGGAGPPPADGPAIAALQAQHAQVRAEIADLHRLIAEASQRAARSVSSGA